MHWQQPLIRVALVLFAFLTFADTMQGQVLYGSVVGTVEDPAGAVVPNATITLISKESGAAREGTTDTSGRYSIPNLLPGPYDLKVAAVGFRSQTREAVTVSVNSVTRVDTRLEVGQLTEEITVSAGTVALQTDKADTHTEISTQAITNLPLAGYRNYQSLMNLVPGATPTRFQNSATDTPGRSLQTNINGTNPNNNVTRIDGAASINVWLPHHAGYVMPEEMVETVNVTTSAADAEQGFAGGGAITVVTKSGTNQLHGSLFEFHDNQHLKARNTFQAASVDKPLGIYNNYGGTLGGPIVKNKLFWFFSYDATRQRNGSVATYSVPTDDIRTGDFSAYNTIIFDPATGNADGSGRSAFPDNKIPDSRISEPAKKIQEYFPSPNLAGPLSNYFAAATPRFDRDYADVKINWNRNDRHMVWGRYGRMWATVGGTGIYGEGGGPAPGSDPGIGDTKVQNTSAGHTYTLSPTLLLDGVFGYQRQDQNVKGTDFGTNFGEVLGIPGLNGPDERQSGFPNIAFLDPVTGNAHYSTMGVPGWMPLFRVEENYTTSQNLTWIKGAHEFRFGFDGLLLKLNHWQPELGNGPRGQINFTGGTTAEGPRGAAGNLNAYASFLLGLPYQMQKSVQYLTMVGNEWQFGLYVRDRWQATRKLTVSLGLRYEYFPLMNRGGGTGIERLDPETNTVYLGGRGSVPTSNGITVSKKLFAPRVGIAYRLGDSTVLRTGYGLTYDPLPFSRPLRGFYPLTVNFNFEALESAYAAVNTLEQGIPAVQGPDLSTGAVQLPAVADMRSPYAGEIHRGYIQSWNFTLERKLPLDLVSSLAYVGTQTTNQFADRDINAAIPGMGQAGRPYAAQFNRRTATNMWDGYLSSHYHSLQTSINKQFTRGLMIKGAYTWSKAINMTDDDGWASVGWDTPSQFDRNRAPAGYDRTHIFQMGWVYELPFGRGHQIASSGPASYIAGGWQINGILAAYTGVPFTVNASSAALNTPGETQTADQVKPTVEKYEKVGAGTSYYDITAFATPTDKGRFGSTGRNYLRGPGLFNVDLSLFKNFEIKERYKFQFRAEFFNFSNTPHFGNATGNLHGMASTTVGNENFLRVTSSYGERQVRLGLRFAF